MRDYDSATVDHLASRAGIVARQLVWIEARNLETQAVEAIGLWTGEENATLTIAGAARPYLGAGTLLKPEPMAAAVGLAVRVYRVQLAAVAPEVEELVKGYDTRFAPLEIHRALYDPATRQLIAEPHRVYRGLVNSITFPQSAAGGSPACIVEGVSETRVLTRSLALKKSDESQRTRGGDRFRRYGDISAAVPVYWGEKRVGGEAFGAVTGGSTTAAKTGGNG